MNAFRGSVVGAGLILSLSWVSSAQMTPEQKTSDFTQLAATLAKNYGPLQWKRDAFQFDLLNIGDWLKRAAASKDDLGFYDVCVQYIASLQDAHTGFYLPSDFTATLPFKVDLYDGKAIVDTVSQRQNSGSPYPVSVGDEILAVDGTPVGDVLQSLAPYAMMANPVSTRRLAAAYLTTRPQALMPRANETPDHSQLMLRHPDGTVVTAMVDWAKSGTPLTMIGPVLTPHAVRAPSDVLPDYMAPLRRLRKMSIPEIRFVQGFGSIRPIFKFPSTFQIRRGDRATDFFYSGTYNAEGYRIGFLRIPDFSASGASSAYAAELQYMQQNTDGLVLDIMRNPGGDGCFAEVLLSMVIPYPFRTVGLEVRATRTWVEDFQAALADAIDSGASQPVIDQYQQTVRALQAAYLTPSGRTPAIPVCGPTLDLQPATGDSGAVTAYSKPIVLLTDEFSASAADLFAAVFQDAHRGPVVGNRTMGAGGNVDDFPNVTTYSDGDASITESLMVRSAPAKTPDFPVSAYVENVGVRPDIPVPYMTVDNLTTGGQAFVDATTRAILDQIRAWK